MLKYNFKEDNIINYIIKKNFPLFFKLGIVQLIVLGISFGEYLTYTYIVDKVLISENPSLKKLVIIVGGYLVLIVVQEVVSFVNNYLSMLMQLKNEVKIKREIIDKILLKKGSYFSKNNSGELFEVIMQDVGVVSNYVIGNVFNIIGLTVNLVGTIIFLFMINWVNVIIILIFQLVSFFIQKKVSKSVYNLSGDVRDNLGKYVSSLQDLLDKPEDMLMSGLKTSFASRFDDCMMKDYRLNKKLTFINIGGSSSIGLVSQMTIGAVLFNSGLSIISGSMTIGYMVTFITSTKDLLNYISGLWNLSINLFQIGPMYERLNSLYLDKDEEKKNTVDNTINPSIEFEHVTFSYDNEQILYNDFNQSFRFGMNYGIVGRTGQGKSTIVKLIYDLWEPQKGKILLGETPCKDLSVDEISKYIDYVSAMSILVEDTIYNNVALGNDKLSRDDAIEALKKACIYDEVMMMEKGMDTVVGSKGSTLSSGQKQRIMLARALASEKKILILDEPTSALDVETERSVMDNIYREYRDKTLIIISHNKEILDRCDEVLQLINGRLQIA